MAKLGWLGSVGIAVAAGAGAAAAQFGLGYGFGVIAWSPAAGTTSTSDGIWLASLAWTLWIAATSTVVGAVAADRRSAGEIGAAPPRGGAPSGRSRPTVMATAIWRALLAVAASIGALLSVVLVLPPAHNASRPDTTSPHLIAAGYAIVGIIIGIVLAVCALAARAAVTNVVITSIWLWVLAAASVVVNVANGRGYGTAVLEGWPLHDSMYFWHNFSVDLTALVLGTAIVAGAASAWAAIRRGDNRVGVVLSGGTGPLLVAAAYVLTAPALVGVSGNRQASTSVITLCGVIAGLAGSGLLVAAVAAREAAERERANRGAGSDDDLDTVALSKPVGASVPGNLTPGGGSASAGAKPSATGAKPSAGKPNPADQTGGPAPVPGPSASTAADPAKGAAAAPGKGKPTSATSAKAQPAARPTPGPTVSGAGVVPAPRDASEDQTERIPTSPRRAPAGADSAGADSAGSRDAGSDTSDTTTTQRPTGGANGKRGRRR